MPQPHPREGVPAIVNSRAMWLNCVALMKIACQDPIMDIYKVTPKGVAIIDAWRKVKEPVQIWEVPDA